MKIDHLMFICAAIAFSPLAMAETQFNNQKLGETQAIFDFCAQVNGVSTAKYHEQERLLFADTSEQEFDKSKNTGDYKKAYEQTSDSLGKIPQQDAILACQGFQMSDERKPSRREYDAYEDKHDDRTDLSVRKFD